MRDDRNGLRDVLDKRTQQPDVMAVDYLRPKSLDRVRQVVHPRVAVRRELSPRHL